MSKSRRQFEFGPYTTPRFRYGAVAQCEVRGEVVIVGLSKGRIPWPIGRRPGERFNAYIVFNDLAKALKSLGRHLVGWATFAGCLGFGDADTTDSRYGSHAKVVKATSRIGCIQTRNGQSEMYLAAVETCERELSLD